MSMKIDKSLILNEIKSHYGIDKDADFARFLEIKPQTLASWHSRNTFDIDLLYSKCEGISGDFLLSGQGGVVKNKEYINDKESEMYLVAEKRPLYNSYPLVSPKAIGGFGGSSFAIEEKDVKDYYIVPKFKHKKIDFMIEVEGPSMYPKYNSGDVVACTIIKESNFIQWHKVHVIATREQGIIIKRIEPSEKEGFLKMISDNEKYSPFDVPNDEITGIALVVGVIRLE